MNRKLSPDAALAAFLICMLAVAGIGLLAARADFASIKDQDVDLVNKAAALSFHNYRLELKVASLEAQIKRLAGQTFDSRQAAQAIVTACGDDISPDVIVRLIQRESSWRPRARGRHGEIGLTQIKASTAGKTARELEDPVANIQAGIAHLRRLKARVGETGLALAAYNGGLYAPAIRYAIAVKGE